MDRFAQPMKTPPLTWVRAFREAGRQGSFKQAAAVLNLAPSTVSHEIRKLEESLGQSLFDRGPRTAQLTDEGQKLYALVEPAFDQLDAAFIQFEQSGASPLRVGMLPFLASELVLPNIERFASQLGNQGIEITSAIQLSTLNPSDASKRIDAVVRYAKQAPEGYESVPLTNVSLALVAGGPSPELAKASAQETSHRHIKLNGNFDGWERLREAGFEVPKQSDTPIVVDNYLSAMRAVEQGLGIGIAVLPLCESWLSEGRIHLLNNNLCELDDRYWLVWRKASPKNGILVALAEHMKTEFAAATQRISAQLQR